MSDESSWRGNSSTRVVQFPPHLFRNFGCPGESRCQIHEVEKLRDIYDGTFVIYFTDTCSIPRKEKTFRERTKVGCLA